MAASGSDPGLDFERLRALFLRAAGLPEAERAAFLERECVGEPALHAELEAMLAPRRPNPLDSRAGVQRLLEQIARVGVGDTVLARLGEAGTLAPRGLLAGRSSAASASHERGEEAGERPLFGRYRVLDSGTLDGHLHRLQALDLDLRREVEIVVPEAGDEGRAAFDGALREARVRAGLVHPGVRTVHEIGTDEGGRERSVVSAPVRGRPLAELLREGAFAASPRRLLDLLQRLAETLAHAHERGVCHGAVAPDRVAVDEFGVVQLLDWSAARSPATAGEIARDVRFLLELVLEALSRAGGGLDGDGALADALSRLGDGIPPGAGDGSGVQPGATAAEVGRVLGDYVASLGAARERAEVRAAADRFRARGDRRTRWLTVGIATALATTLAVLAVGRDSLAARREARERRAADDVHAALDRAQLLRGAGHLDEALELAHGAERLAGDTQAPEEASTRATALGTALAAEVAARRAGEERTREDGELSTRLEEIAAWSPCSYREPDPLHGPRGYAAALGALGVVPLAPMEPVLARLRDRTIGPTLVRALDRWAAGCPRADEARWLFELANALHAPASEQAARRALAEASLEDRRRLPDLIAALDPLTASAATVDLASRLLLGTGQAHEAVALARTGRLEHMDDFFLGVTYAEALEAAGLDGNVALCACYRTWFVAGVLRPGLREVRHRQGLFLERIITQNARFALPAEEEVERLWSDLAAETGVAGEVEGAHFEAHAAGLHGIEGWGRD